MGVHRDGVKHLDPRHRDLAVLSAGTAIVAPPDGPRPHCTIEVEPEPPQEEVETEQEANLRNHEPPRLRDKPEPFPQYHPEVACQRRGDDRKPRGEVWEGDVCQRGPPPERPDPKYAP